jgi:hypothetical protein
MIYKDVPITDFLLPFITSSKLKIYFALYYTALCPLQRLHSPGILSLLFHAVRDIVFHKRAWSNNLRVISRR